MHILFAHPLIAFLLWTLLAVAFGLLLGKVIAHADAIEQPQPEQLGTDTVFIDWNNAPREWIA